jgi:hypothetical protein
VTLVVSAQHTSAPDALQGDSRLCLLHMLAHLQVVWMQSRTPSSLTLDGCSSVRGASRLRTGELRINMPIGSAAQPAAAAADPPNAGA